MSQFLDNIALDEISEVHLESLITLKISESTQIEYKSILSITSESEKKEFCKDVTAMAHSQGGYLFFGIAEKNEIPYGIPGIQFDNRKKRQILQILTSGISPHFEHFYQHVISLKNGLKVLVIRINPDGKLHQVKYGDNRYYKRVGTITVIMDSFEIETFLLGATSTTRLEAVQTIVNGYYAKLKTGDYFKGVSNKGICTLTLIPEVSSIQLNLSQVPNNFNTLFPPISCSGWNLQITGSSRYLYSPSINNNPPYAVTEITEFGEVKAYNSSLLDHFFSNRGFPQNCTGFIPSISYEQEIIRSLHQYLQSLNELEISGPFYIDISLLNVKGYIMYNQSWWNGGRVFAKEDIHPPSNPLVINNQYLERQDIAKTVRTIFDYIWREFGFERDYNYTESGEWKLQ